MVRIRSAFGPAEPAARQNPNLDRPREGRPARGGSATGFVSCPLRSGLRKDAYALIGLRGGDVSLGGGVRWEGQLFNTFHAHD